MCVYDDAYLLLKQSYLALDQAQSQVAGMVELVS